MITSKVDDLFFSVNDIYTQFDEGEISYEESVAILKRICNHFLEETSNEN
jgi:hypothetical protein